MIQNLNWQKVVERNLSLFKTDTYIGGLVPALKKHFNFNLKNILIHGKGEECTFYVESKNLKAFEDLILKHVLDSIKLNKNPMDLLNNLQNDSINIAKEIGRQDLSSKQKLIEAYNKFTEIQNDYQLVIWFPVLCEGSLFNYAKERLIQLTKDEKAWNIIAEPFEPSIIQEEMIDLLKVAINYSDERLKNHKEKYEWLSMRFIENTPFDLDYFKQRLERIDNPKQELERITKSLEENKNKFFNLLNSLNLSEEDRKLFITVNQLSLLRQRRDIGRRKTFYNIQPLFKKMLSVLGCDYSVLLSYLTKDVIQHLKEEKSLTAKSDIQEYIYMFKEGNFKFIKNENVLEQLKQEGIQKSLKIDNSTEIKGRIAHRGKVQGKVKIIKLRSIEKDIAELKKGEILVTISTKPEFVIAMEKAAAFITDEGGITCHAAIVAREMNKPCIVGTNVATKVLKDGDLVEVDAEKGVVRKIGE